MPHAHQRARARICPFFPRTHENWVQHPMDARAHTCNFTHAHVGVHEALVFFKMMTDFNFIISLESYDHRRRSFFNC